jgi:hypothetical protein
MKLTFLILLLAGVSVAAPVIHLDSVTPNFAFVGPSNSIALTKVEVTITGLTVGQSFSPSKSSDLTNWVGDIGRVVATNSTFHYESYNSVNVYTNQVFYRVELP